MQLVMELEQDLKVANVICMVLPQENFSLQTLFDPFWVSGPYELIIISERSKAHILFQE